MLYHLRKRSQEVSKWITAALIGIYIMVALMLFMYNPENDGNAKSYTNSSYNRGPVSPQTASFNTAQFSGY